MTSDIHPKIGYMNRDNFDPVKLLHVWREDINFELTHKEAMRLLEEGCHAHVRVRNELEDLKCFVSELNERVNSDD